MNEDIATLALTYCLAAYWLGWLTSYGFSVFRRFLLTVTS